MQNLTKIISACALATSIVACGGSSSNDTGTLSIAVTDAPVDGATEVVVIFNSIELNPKNGNNITIDFDPAQSIDLLALQNGKVASLLQAQSLPAGEYNWMRLGVDADQGEIDSYIKFDTGLMYSLYVPSGDNTGLKLNRAFTIAAGGNVSFTIDFDLRKSINKPGNNSDDYKLRPTLRIIDNTEVGQIAGTIMANSVLDVSCNEGLAVYAYIGSEVIADDEGSATPPISSAIPVYDATSDSYDYQLSFLLAGEYTLALTCDAENDDAETDEVAAKWSALTSANATVSIDQTTTLNF